MKSTNLNPLQVIDLIFLSQTSRPRAVFLTKKFSVCPVDGDIFARKVAASPHTFVGVYNKSIDQNDLLIDLNSALSESGG